MRRSRASPPHRPAPPHWTRFGLPVCAGAALHGFGPASPKGSSAAFAAAESGFDPLDMHMLNGILTRWEQKMASEHQEGSRQFKEYLSANIDNRINETTTNTAAILQQFLADQGESGRRQVT